MDIDKQIDKSRLPRHIAIIMDGNGRWAKQHGLARSYGHEKGVESVHEITTVCAELGIEYLTLYAFSTENWNRPQAEVEALMALLVETIEKETETLCKNNVRLLTIGETWRLPQTTRDKLNECLARTAQNTGLTLVIALSYSSRWEISEAMKECVRLCERGEVRVEDINDNFVSSLLTTKDIPDPDLLIRTSGEQRISNFLLWQLAYSELYFTNTLWPDFRRDELYAAIIDYQSRERRFGKTSEQIKTSEN